MEIKIPCVYMRTGTSKSLYFRREDLPEDAGLRDRYLLAAMGSPDTRQINGMGGGDVSTSKIAVISKSAREDCDVDYTFGQVSLTQAKIDYSGNCGNCSSGVGVFAVDERLVPAVEPVTVIKIWNTNTKKILVERVRVKDGKAEKEGSCVIDGVPGSGSPIELDFRNTVGASTGSLLPTGNRVDELDVENVGRVSVTIADVGNPVVFFEATAVGATGLESRPEINANQELMEKIEAVRQSAAEKIHLIRKGESAREISPMKPLAVMFAPPADYADYTTGKRIAAREVDFVAKNIMNQLCIDTFAVTAALCTGVAASLHGTVLNCAVGFETKEDGRVRIGHSRGVSEVYVVVSENETGDISVEKAVMLRTARKIMEGNVCFMEQEA